MRKFILTISLLGGLAPSAWCVPQVLNFQGRLLESGALVNGSRVMTFKIFDAASGGNQLFAESRSVNVSTGAFNVLVGDATTGGIPLFVFDGGDRYIEVQVGAQTLPRQRVVSVGYSFRSDSASYATKAGSLLEATTAQPVVLNVTQVNVTTIAVTGLIASGATVTGSLKVGNHTIILGENPATGGVPNTIAFETGDAFIKTQDPSAGNLNLEAGANKNILLSGGGNVGVGAASPETKMHVDGVVTSGQASATTGGLKLYNSASPNATILQAGNATSAVTYKLPPADGLAGQVLTTDGAGNLQWTYVTPPVPTLTTVSPSNGFGVGGTAITLGGAGFKSGATVAVGGNLATDVIFVNSTQILAKTPPGVAGPQNVTVTNPDANFTTLIGGFTYVPSPVIQSIVPNTGLTAGGQTITLNGTGFQNGATVTIGGTPATGITFVNANQIRAVTPAKPDGAYNVVVTNPDSQFSNSFAFTYNVACGGYLYQGACWYLTPWDDGVSAMPCEGTMQPRGDGTNIYIGGVCDAHGGYNEAATRDIAGSGSPSNANCFTIAKQLKPTITGTTCSTQYADPAADYQAFGCVITLSINSCKRYATPITTGWPRSGANQRICACNQ
ncbi:MAG: IPT/TIG domain-containing protein [Elusimicrobia bacterium]|nr:IPT/TIG domain-containing protein [Elusimicrobiota bacterium]